MPLPMVHLAVAVQLYDRTGQAPPGAFLLGSLAPDAIHARPGTTREDKNNTHFQLNGDQTAFMQRVKEFGERSRHLSGDGLLFTYGYMAHVLTDSLWAITIYSKFKRSVEGQLAAEQRKELYYRETEKVDFQLFRQESWVSSVWKDLRTASPYQAEELVSLAEVAYWQTHVLNWFDEHSEPEQVPNWITEDVVREFIKTAARAVEAQWQQWGLSPFS